ncbi:MAG: hypothetical protein D3911_11355 [Candidatus Electrothrix sp. AW3_4]|nr:hypothetical protein [Candidatus Electrothrix gigas]
MNWCFNRRKKWSFSFYVCIGLVLLLTGCVQEVANQVANSVTNSVTNSVSSASSDVISNRMVDWITNSASASVKVAKGSSFHPQRIKKIAVIMKPDRRYRNVPYRRVEDIFMFDLLNKGYQVASRSDVKQVMEELHFQGSLLTEEKIAEIGRILNVSAMLIVSVTDLGYERQQSGSNYVSAALGTRLIGVEKAEFLWGGRCSGTGSQIGSTLEDLAEKISKAFPSK